MHSQYYACRDELSPLTPAAMRSTFCAACDRKIGLWLDTAVNAVNRCALHAGLQATRASVAAYPLQRLMFELCTSRRWHTVVGLAATQPCAPCCQAAAKVRGRLDATASGACACTGSPARPAARDAPGQDDRPLHRSHGGASRPPPAMLAAPRASLPSPVARRCFFSGSSRSPQQRAALYLTM